MDKERQEGIVGELCTTKEELRKAATRRRKEFLERSVTPSQAKLYVDSGWELIRKGKTSCRIRKKKTTDEILEDKVWLLFYRMGFHTLNKERDCKLQFDTFSKKIDVLAKDEDNIFVVECKSSELEGPVNAKDALEEYSGKRKEIRNAIEATWGKKPGRISILIALSSLGKRNLDVEYARERNDKNMFLWSLKEIGYLEKLVSQVGHAARYQLYSVIFANKPNSQLELKCPAIRAKIGGNLYYSFMIHAKALLKYAYVHHRDLTGITEVSEVYQRMLKNSKLREIQKFIDEESGFFANSIIVNFSHKLRWDLKQSTSDGVAMGMLTLPKYHGSAWIIDGQHRLYGAARANKDVLIPVLAFQEMGLLKQANLFIEINEKQTRVPKELLWDLYSDIYRESSDPKQKRQFSVAETVKRMQVKGPLSYHIEIPSIPAKKQPFLKHTTVCSSIEKLSGWELLVHPSEPEKTPDNAARILNAYYEVLKELWPEDWVKEKDQVLLSNNGFAVFMLVLQDILKFLVFKERKKLLREINMQSFSNILREKFLSPIIVALKSDVELQKEIISFTGGGPQNLHATFLEQFILHKVPSFSSSRLDKLSSRTEPIKKDNLSLLSEKASLAEVELRKYVLRKIKSEYGEDKWWKHGVPGELKKKVDDLWMKQVKRKPHLQHLRPPNDTKFDYLSMGEMKDVIVYGENWDKVFESELVDKNAVERRINDVAALRNPVSHKRSMDDQDVVDGYGGLLWLSNSLAVPNLNPNIDQTSEFESF